MRRVSTQVQRPVKEIHCDFAQSQSPTPRCGWVTSDTSGNVSAAESHILQTGQKVICAWLVQIGAGLSVGNVRLNTRGGQAVRQSGRRTPSAAESKHARLSSQNSSDGAQRPPDQLSPPGHSCWCSSLKYVFRVTKVTWWFFFFFAVAARTWEAT